MEPEASVLSVEAEIFDDGVEFVETTVSCYRCQNCGHEEWES